MIKPIMTFDPFNPKKQDVILRKETQKILDSTSDSVKQCIIDLNDTLADLTALYGCVRGIGLSAPQIGYSLSISAIHTDNTHFILLNPRIIGNSDTQKLFRIGCFSLYQYRALVKYYDSVTIEYLDENGNINTITVNDDLALVFQHEIDHLHGILSFDRMPNKENDLFIPREKLFHKRVPLKNYGFIYSIRQKLHLIKPQSTLQYYSFLFNYSYDYNGYVESSAQKREELVDILLKYCNHNTKIIEAGCGTSSISIYISKKGYHVECVDINNDMLSLAKEINSKTNGTVKYLSGDIQKLPYQDNYFDVVYSHGVLEHFNNAQKKEIIIDGLRIASTYIISVPTIWDVSNNLLGDEILWSIHRWELFLKQIGLEIIEIKKAFPTTPKLEKFNNYFGIIPSGNVIFVVKNK